MADIARSVALVRACHPGACLVIAAIIVTLAAKSGPGHRDLLVFAVAALAGQVSIGWSNDAFDAPRDTAAGRVDKPIVAGAVSRRAVAWAAGVALVLSVVLSFWLGAVTGGIDVLMMAAAWAYNAGLKATLASGLMYLVGFGPIPAFAASLSGHRASAVFIGAAAVLGLGAHFANVLPDLDVDHATGVRGLPQRVAAAGGVALARGIALALLVVASAMIATGAHGTHRIVALGGLVLATVVAILGARSGGRRPFLAALGIALIDVVMFVLAG